MNHFLQIYGTLPRAGPGSNQLTRQAFEMMSDISESPRILDIGCGPGMQTVELLKITSGTVVAIDLLPEMIAEVKARAENAGVSDRLDVIEQDMTKMAFPESSFDVVWSEGAIYLLGFEAGLKKIKDFVKPGGYVAISEVVWLKPDPPAEVVEFWQQYPEIDTVAAKLDIIQRTGYESVGHFIFPTTAWTEHYYTPMEKRIAEKTTEWRSIPEAEAVLQEATNEISIFRKCSDYYSYAFFVMRN
ncbi:MAG: class I SAM-dependent methyltransferase [Cyanobacteria bacterium P01_F01_bin.116]